MDTKMIQIPHIGAEKLAGTDHKVSLDDLTRGPESSDDMLDDILVLDILKRKVIHLTMEELALLKDIPHGIHL